MQIIRILILSFYICPTFIVFVCRIYSYLFVLNCENYVNFFFNVQIHFDKSLEGYLFCVETAM